MKIDLSGISVALVMPTRNVNDISVPTVVSLIGTINMLHDKGIPFETQIHTGGTITGTRSFSVCRFLETQRNRMFFLDSDVVWQPEDFLKILALSTVYPIVGAVYRAKRDAPLFLVNANMRGDVPDEYGCLPVNGMGLGFTCIQRPLLEQLSARAPKIKYMHRKEPIPKVFRFDELNGEERGEDMAFCSDIRDLGYAVKIDPNITLGHIGLKDFRGCLADQLGSAAEAAE